jgi:DNA-binding transcriptional ArsR family regulator
MSSIFPIRDKVSLDREPEPRLVDLDEETADEVFEALASGTTRKIFLELHNQPQTASDLAEVTDTSVQNVQYHLEKLADVDLVEVVDTWYSERGSEMKVYAPQDESLVLFAGRDKQSTFRRLLNRFAGLFAVLLPPSILAGWLASRGNSSVEKGIRGEYASGGDSPQETTSRTEGEPAGASGDGDVGIQSETEDQTGGDDSGGTDGGSADGGDGGDGGGADGGDTPVPEATDTPTPEGTPTPEPSPTPKADGGSYDPTAQQDQETIEITVDNASEAAELAAQNETVYLVVDKGGSDIMGIDPQVALAFFVGGLLVYAAFMLRKRVI